MKKKVVKKRGSGKKTEKSYIIEDSVFGQFTIKYTDNPWWKDKEKVVKLITGFKMDCKPAELRILTGITDDQMRYFFEKHEELSRIFEDFRKTPTLKARATVVRAVTTDVGTAFKYLERKEADEFREKKDIEFSEKPSLIQNMFIDE